MLATQVGVGPDGVIMIYPWNSPAKSSRVYKGIRIPRTWEPTVQFNSKAFIPLYFLGYLIPKKKELHFHMWVMQVPPYTWQLLIQTLVNDPGSTVLHNDYPIRALIKGLEVRTMRTPRSASIHKLRLSVLQMRPMQSLLGPLPLHHTRSQNHLDVSVWWKRCRVIRGGWGASRSLHDFFEEANIQPTQPEPRVRGGLGGQLLSGLHGLEIQGPRPGIAYVALKIMHFGILGIASIV